MICDVDIGIGERHRRAFLQRLSTVKNGIIPTPKVILVVGDDKNRCGRAGDISVGCSVSDLAVMTDGHMKRRLEHAARLIEELRDPARQEALMIMGARTAAPSVAHIFVVEALIILLLPSKVFNACRGNRKCRAISISSMKEATWAQVRFILITPEKLLTAMAGMDEYGISPANISSLKVTWLFLTFTMDISIMIGTQTNIHHGVSMDQPTDRMLVRAGTKICRHTLITINGHETKVQPPARMMYCTP